MIYDAGVDVRMPERVAGLMEAELLQAACYNWPTTTKLKYYRKLMVAWGVQPTMLNAAERNVCCECATWILAGVSKAGRNIDAWYETAAGNPQKSFLSQTFSKFSRWAKKGTQVRACGGGPPSSSLKVSCLLPARLQVRA